jgi:hypothetical protein
MLLFKKIQIPKRIESGEKWHTTTLNGGRGGGGSTFVQISDSFSGICPKTNETDSNKYIIIIY